MEVVQKVSYRIQIGISNDKLNTCIALFKKKNTCIALCKNLRAKGLKMKYVNQPRQKQYHIWLDRNL